MTSRAKETYIIRTVDSALRVLEALGEYEGAVGVSHLSEQLGMNKSHVYRILTTLKRKNYVEKDALTGKYHLGLYAYEMGQRLLSSMELLNKAKPVMNRLSRKCNEAIYLAVPRGQEVLLLDMVNTTQMIAVKSLVGKRYPIQETSIGNVCRAFGNEPPCSSIDRERSTILRRGFDVGCGDLGEGIVSLAAPLLNASKILKGCLCIIGPEHRLSKDLVEKELSDWLQDAGEIISAKLGYFRLLQGRETISAQLINCN